jgi:lipopolysaccharide biosynthesis regulator YciM
VAAGVALAALLFVGVTWQRQLTAAWYANLGALEQSRVELSAYDPNHFDNPTLDQVRQRANLDRATALFERAAQIDPANPTARQRLATIKLSRGQYASALYEMQAAWDAGHHDAVTRKLLGDAYVANGRVKEAAQLVQGLAWADGRLAGQAWYRYEQSHDYQRAADAWAAVVLLKPGDASLVAAQAEAAHQAGQ